MQKTFGPTQDDLIDLKRVILDIKNEKSIHIRAKIKQQGILSKINSILNDPKLEKEDYEKARMQKKVVKKELEKLELFIQIINNNRNKKQKLLEAVEFELRKNKNINKEDNKVIQSLLQLRKEYQDFSSDHTRISSMRIMASQLVEKLDKILKS